MLGSRTRPILGFAIAIVAVLALVASPASAAVTVGNPLDVPPDDGSGSTGPGQPDATYVVLTLPSGATASSPINGVITSWRVRGYTEGADPAEILLRVIRPAGGSAFTAVSSASALLPTSNATHRFATRRSIHKGDYVGITQTGGTRIWVTCELCAGSIGSYGGAFPDGATHTMGSGTSQITVNATVEPDADNDGYGDETQDKCSTNPSTQAADFTLGKAERNKKKGTAKLPVDVTCAGTLELAGEGLKAASADATGAGEVKLAVKAKGKTRKKLKRKGKKKVKPSVTFTPTGGTANTEQTKLKLVKK